MKKILSTLLIISIFIIFAGSAFARDIRVKGYYRSNGTYVQPHYRTSPDNSLFNNYSTKGNVNPYTGSKGYVDPYGNSSITGGIGRDSYELPSITGSYGNNSIGCNPFGSTLGSSLLGFGSKPGSSLLGN